MTTELVSLSDLDRAIEADARRVEGAIRTAVETAWNLGKRLIERRARTPHGEWAPYLASVGITERSANRYMTMGRQIGHVSDLKSSIRGTLAAISETTQAAENDRQARNDRLAVRLESCPDGVDPVEYLQGLLDNADREHAENVALIAKAKREAEAERRKFRDIGSALRAGRDVDGALVQFFGVSRKAA